MARNLIGGENMSLSHWRYPDMVDKKKAAVLAAALIGQPPATAPDVSLHRLSSAQRSGSAAAICRPLEPVVS